MNIRPIKTEKEYKATLLRIEALGDPKPGTEQGDEFEILCILVEKYEDEHYPIAPPDPVEAIMFRMEQLGYKPKDLERIIGSKGRVSEVLNRKRKLSLSMIRKLNEKLHIPADILVRDYKLAS